LNLSREQMMGRRADILMGMALLGMMAAAIWI
jgi:hypothetical protein